MSDDDWEADFELDDAIDEAFQDFASNGTDEAARVLFNIFDKNHDNRVSIDEVFQIISKLAGLEPGYQTVVEDMYKASDANADGTLDFEEFKVFIRKAN
jgi:Ca2+-binding EF-hand superfamily protein